MESSRDDESYPHAEVVYLVRLVSKGMRDICNERTSRNLERVKARTHMPMSFVIVIPERTCKGR